METEAAVDPQASRRALEAQLAARLAGAQDLPAAFTQLLDLLDPASSTANDEHLATQPATSHVPSLPARSSAVALVSSATASSAPVAGLSAGYLTGAVRQLVQGRGALLEELLLFLTWLTAGAGPLSDATARELETAGLPRTATLLQAYAGLQWLAGAYKEPSEFDASLASPEDRFSTLSLSQLAPPPTDHSLLRAVCEDHLATVATIAISSSSPVDFQTEVARCLSCLDPGASASREAVTLAMHHHGQARHLLALARLAACQDQPTVQRLLGHAYLRLHHLKEAQSQFLHWCTLLAGSSAEGTALSEVLEVVDLFTRHEGGYVGAVALCYAAMNLPGITPKDRTSVCMRLFKYALLLPDYRQAYAALLMLQDTYKQDCLHQLVTTLCQRRELEVLCAELPWRGLRAEVENTLLWNARNMDLSGPKESEEETGQDRRQPNYYRILYAFLLEAHDYQTAASYMYVYALRLEAEARGDPILVLRRQAEAYLAVINALHLAPDQWILHAVAGTQEVQEAVVVSLLPPPEPKRRRMDEGSGPGHVVLELHHVQKRHLLCLTRLELSLQLERTGRRMEGSTGLRLGAEETVSLLLEEGLVELAMTVALHFSPEDLGAVFASLTDKCLRLQLQGRQADEEAEDPSDDVRLQMDPPRVTASGTKVAVSRTTVGRADQAWALLSTYLIEYDTADSNYRYRAMVAEAILEKDDRLDLPLWLIELFKGEVTLPLPVTCAIDGDHGFHLSVTNAIVRDSELQLHFEGRCDDDDAARYERQLDGVKVSRGGVERTASSYARLDATARPAIKGVLSFPARLFQAQQHYHLHPPPSERGVEGPRVPLLTVPEAGVKGHLSFARASGNVLPLLRLMLRYQLVSQAVDLLLEYLRSARNGSASKGMRKGPEHEEGWLPVDFVEDLENTVLGVRDGSSDAKVQQFAKDLLARLREELRHHRQFA
jgi:hypothetical protein